MSKTLPKYAREYHDDFENYLCSANNIKKKELLQKIESLDVDSFKKFLFRKSVTRRRDNLTRAIANLDNEIDELYFFNSSLHFCTTSIPEDVNFNAFASDVWDKDIFIDFEFNGVPYFLHAWKCNYPTKILYSTKAGSAEFDYQIMVFANIPEMFDYNRFQLQNQFDMLWKFSKVYKVHVSKDAKDFITEISGSNFWMLNELDSCNSIETLQFNFISSSEESLYSKLGVVTPKDLIKLVNHVMYCYTNREHLTRKNGKARKRYDSCVVHTVQECGDVKDQYVPLTVYHASERKSTEYKGGHHASPKEHDRRAFYRRSRGRGDYALVDGKMVYVGNKDGNYSLVKKTHVSGKKANSLKIYKVQ